MANFVLFLREEFNTTGKSQMELRLLGVGWHLERTGFTLANNIWIPFELESILKGNT